MAADAARPPSPAAPTPAQRPAAPVSAARRELLVLRRTLIAWGTPPGARELAAFDAWAAWIVVMLGESLLGGAPPADVRPLTDHADARQLVLELSLAPLRRTAGMRPEERRAVWSQAQAGEELVTAMLTRTTRRRS